MLFGMGRSTDDEEGGGGMLGALVMMIVAPIAAALIQMAISRSREYLADATGAQICGHPASLASALQRLDDAPRILLCRKSTHLAALARPRRTCVQPAAPPLPGRLVDD